MRPHERGRPVRVGYGPRPPAYLSLAGLAKHLDASD